jgi:uncharacterized small protein (DUF1192 family)
VAPDYLKETRCTPKRKETSVSMKRRLRLLEARLLSLSSIDEGIVLLTAEIELLEAEEGGGGA